MRVVVPYTDLKPVVRQVLDSYGLPVEYVRLEDDYAYGRLLLRLWMEGETTVLVEHDVLPWPGAIEELWGCPCQWGAYTYRLHGGLGIYHGFGCTKLSAELMRATPGLWDEPGKWDVLDQRLLFAARAVGQEPHHHRPAVIHLSTAEHHRPRTGKEGRTTDFEPYTVLTVLDLIPPHLRRGCDPSEGPTDADVLPTGRRTG